MINKILVIRLSSFGDIVLSFQLLKLLRKTFPSAEINFITRDKYRDVVSLSSDINRIIVLKESLSEARKIIKSENYDLIIDLHKNMRSFFLSFANAKHIVRYKKENVKKFFLVNFKWNLFKQIIPVWKKYIAAAGKFIPLKDYKFTKIDLNFDKNKRFDFNYLVIAPSARHFTKTYPDEKFIDAINAYANSAENVSKKLKIVLVGDNTERDMRICRQIELKTEGVLNLCGQLDIKVLASILYNSEYVICNDSSILHLSEVLGKKVIAIFGSTVKEFGFFPQLQYSQVKEIQALKCRPCTHIGRDKCPLGHFKCMREIELTISD